MEYSTQAGAMTVMVCGKGAPQPESAKYVLETVELEKVEPHTVSVTGAVCDSGSSEAAAWRSRGGMVDAWDRVGDAA